jgi:hypothetical protein
VSDPAAMCGHASRCGSVGPSGNRRRNHVPTAGWNPSTSAWGYPRKPKRIGKGMIDFIFASNHLPVYQWGTSADITPDRLSLQNGFPSDHNMIFAQIGLP